MTDDKGLLDYPLFREHLTCGTKIIFIDIDLRYDGFIGTRTYRLMMVNLYRIKRDWHIVDRAYIRRSSSGNVHIRIDLTEFVTFAVMMVIRSMLHDDIYRIGIDLRRIAYMGYDEVNRIFTTKVKDGVIGNVGEWQELEIVMPEIPE